MKSLITSLFFLVLLQSCNQDKIENQYTNPNCPAKISIWTHNTIKHKYALNGKWIGEDVIMGICAPVGENILTIFHGDEVSEIKILTKPQRNILHFYEDTKHPIHIIGSNPESPYCPEERIIGNINKH